MSFDVYLQSFVQHEPSGVPRASIQDVFEPFIVDDTEGNDLELKYDEANSCSLHLTPLVGSCDSIHAISIHRPCGDSRLWESVIRIMELGNVVFYFPGDSPPLVSNQSVGLHLPPDMIETLGQPACVESHEQLLKYVHSG